MHTDIITPPSQFKTGPTNASRPRRSSIVVVIVFLIIIIIATGVYFIFFNNSESDTNSELIIVNNSNSESEIINNNGSDQNIVFIEATDEDNAGLELIDVEDQVPATIANIGDRGSEFALFEYEEYGFSFQYPKTGFYEPVYKRSARSTKIFIQNYDGVSDSTGPRNKGDVLIEVYIQQIPDVDSCQARVKDAVTTTFGTQSGLLGIPGQNLGARINACIELGDIDIAITVLEIDSTNPVAEILFDSLEFHEINLPTAIANLGRVLPLSSLTQSMFEIDTDGDSINDGFEILHGSSIDHVDTDSDGYNDYAEINSCFNPNGEGVLGGDEFLVYCETFLPFSTWDGSEFLDLSLTKETCALYKEFGEIVAQVRNDGLGIYEIFARRNAVIDPWELCGDLQTLHNTKELDICGAVSFITTAFCFPDRFESLH